MSETASIRIEFKKPEDAKKAYEVLINDDSFYGKRLQLSKNTINDNGSADSFHDYLMFETGAKIIGNIGCVFTGRRDYCSFSTGHELSEYFKSDGKEYSVEDKHDCRGCRKVVSSKNGVKFYNEDEGETWYCKKCAKERLAEMASEKIDDEDLDKDIFPDVKDNDVDKSRQILNKTDCDRYIPNVLLVGNGINRAFGDLSWGSVIDGLSTGEFDSEQKWLENIKTIPFSLQTIVISSDSVSDGMKTLAKKLMPSKLEDDHAHLLRDLISIPFDAILTTNYSYEIETAIDPGFMVREGSASKYRHKTQKGTSSQEQFGIYTYLGVEGHNIWHIHGEAARHSSMIMGHYYYGKLLSEIQNHIPNMIRKYKALCNKGVHYMPTSWIDYFLLGNVYVIGFGMDPSEMDIWWLINCKKRDFNDSGKIYLFEPNLGSEDRFAIRALCDTFNISYDETPVKGDKQYKEYYKKAIARMKELI